MRRTLILFLLALSGVSVALAQDDNDGGKVTFTGSIQSDALIPQEDTKIGAEESEHWGLTNTYADLHMMSKCVDVGARVEFMRFPLPGYENDFKGWGLANIYAKMHIDELEKKLSNKLKSVLSIAAKVKLKAPNTIERSQGKSAHVIDNRNIK